VAQRPLAVSARRTWQVCGGLVLFAIALRLPFFFRAVIDWDESTFVLIGQSLADGHLPYVQLIDVKPPLLFAFFGGALRLFGHDLVGIRLAGALCVGATGWIVFLIAVRWYRRAVSILIAALCIAASSLIQDGQATMSEHVMLPACMGAVLLVTRDRTSLRQWAFAGALLAAATLVRPNMAFGVIAVGLIATARDGRAGTSAVSRLSAYAGGGLVVCALTALPYVFAGQLPILWNAAVSAAMDRSTSENPATANLVTTALAIAGFRRGPSGLVSIGPWLNTWLWICSAGGLAGLWVSRTPRDAAERRGLARVAIIAAAAGISVLMSGGGFAHYLIQLMPFAAILAGALFHHASSSMRRLMWSLTAAFAAVALVPVAAEYQALAARAAGHEPLRTGEARDLAAYLARENPDRRPIFLLTDHIVYWMLRTPPPTQLAHPSSLGRPYVTALVGRTPEQELRRILDGSPEFIVLPERVKYLDADLEALLERTLVERYALATTIEERRVYRRMVH